MQQPAVVVLARGSNIHIQITLDDDLPQRPVELEVRPRQFHLLRRVVGIEGGVQQYGQRFNAQSQSTVQHQSHFVPEGQRWTRVPGRVEYLFEAEVALGYHWLPAGAKGVPENFCYS